MVSDLHVFCLGFSFRAIFPFSSTIQMQVVRGLIVYALFLGWAFEFEAPSFPSKKGGGGGRTFVLSLRQNLWSFICEPNNSSDDLT